MLLLFNNRTITIKNENEQICVILTIEICLKMLKINGENER